MTKKDPSEIYTAEWFTQFPALQKEFDAIGEALVQYFEPTYVLDIGCGPGMTIARMHRAGCNVLGIEGSVHGIAISPVKKLIEPRDITLGGYVPAADLVICTEVAEHLEAAHADTLVEMIANGCHPTHGRVFFTAAPPGQGGHDHVNEQPMSYWLEKFAKRGIREHEAATAEFLPLLKAKIPDPPDGPGWAQTWLFTNGRVLRYA